MKFITKLLDWIIPLRVTVRQLRCDFYDLGVKNRLLNERVTDLQQQKEQLNAELTTVRLERAKVMSANHAIAADSRASAVRAHWDNLEREEQWRKNRGDKSDPVVAAAVAAKPSISPGHHHNSPLPK